MHTPRIVISAGDYGSLPHVLECARVLAPLDHISVVAPARTAPIARGELAWYQGIELIVQMREQRGADLLVPLARAFARDPLASIVFMPSEFCVADPHVLAAATKNALARTDRISVLGWSSAPNVVVGTITAFWDLLREHRPHHAALLECYVEAIDTDDEGTLLVSVYENMDPVDFGELVALAESLEVTMLSTEAIRDNAAEVLIGRRLLARKLRTRHAS